MMGTKSFETPLASFPAFYFPSFQIKMLKKQKKSSMRI